MNTDSYETHYETVLDAGKHWSLRLRRGLTLQLTDKIGGANVGMVLYNAHNLLERYNAPDTLKCQHTFHLTQGHCLYSDMGHVLASIIDDSTNGHETVCGYSSRAAVEKLYGKRTYQQDRNSWKQNGLDAFLVELAKYGLNRADLPANINWFSQCVIGQEGELSLLDTRSLADRTVTLRLEMDCLVILHTCPHPMSVAASYPQMSVGVRIADAMPVAEDDLCMNSCDENRRGFENNRLYHLGYA